VIPPVQEMQAHEFNETELALIFRFVPHDAYLIYALVAKMWLSVWLRLGRARISHMQHFVASMNLVGMARASRCPEPVFKHAVRYGESDVIWHSHVRRDVDESIAVAAAERGDLALFRAMIRAGGLPTDRVCIRAIAADSLEIVQWLYSKYRISSLISTKSLSIGGRRVIQWADAGGFFLCINVCQELAKRGVPELLQWAKDRGYAWSVATVLYAVRWGRSETAIWLIQNGCPVNMDVCYVAANMGNIRILQWAHENGYRMDDDIWHRAVLDDGYAVLEWLYQQGYQPPIGIRVYNTLSRALRVLTEHAANITLLDEWGNEIE